MKKPWRAWKKKTKLEENAIKVVTQGRKIILNNMNKKEVVAIYVKGSLIRRELNKKSDVDILTIFWHSSSLKKLKTLNDKYQKTFNPTLELSGFSLWELKTGKRVKREPGTPPHRFTKHINHFVLIYGSDLSNEKFSMPSEKKYLASRISFIRDTIIHKYIEGAFSFQGLLKQVFWLIESEQFAKGNDPPHGFKALDRSIKDKDHIVHETYRLRLNVTKDKKIKAQFISKLNRYLKRLEKLI